MKTTRLLVHRTAPRATAWLTTLLLVLLAHGVEAKPGGTSSSTPGGPNPLVASSPGEEVTSLPMLNTTSGLTFVGSIRELRALVLAADGNGRIVIEQLGRRLFSVTLFGDYRVELDRARLAAGTVEVLFRGGPQYAGGVGVLQVGNSLPAMVDPGHVPLNMLARLALAPRAQGTLLSLRAVGPSGRRAWLQGDFDLDRVTMTQYLR